MEWGCGLEDQYRSILESQGVCQASGLREKGRIAGWGVEAGSLGGGVNACPWNLGKRTGRAGSPSPSGRGPGWGPRGRGAPSPLRVGMTDLSGSEHGPQKEWRRSGAVWKRPKTGRQAAANPPVGCLCRYFVVII